MQDSFIMKKLISFLLFIPCTLMAHQVHNEKKIIGRTEEAVILPENIKLNAKLDTGAYYSALSAKNIKVYIKDNKKWVEFTYFDGKSEKQLVRPYVKAIKIKKRHAANTNTHKKPAYESRPVVLMRVCLSNQTFTMEASLNNRSGFVSPMLIGRKVIADNHFVIDPSLTNTKRCQENIKLKSKENLNTKVIPHAYQLTS